MDFSRPTTYTREGDWTKATFDPQEFRRFVLSNEEGSYPIRGTNGEIIGIAHLRPLREWLLEREGGGATSSPSQEAPCH